MRAVALVIALLVGGLGGWVLHTDRAGSSSASLVYVANWASLSDATSAGAAAGQSNAPLLFVAADVLPDSTRATLVSMHPQLVVIIGGGFAVSTGVESAIRALGLATQRIAGPNRFDTAAQVAAFAQTHAAHGAAAVVSGGEHESVVALIAAGVTYVGCTGSADYLPLIGCNAKSFITADQITVDPKLYPPSTRGAGDFIFQVQPGTRACVAIYDVFTSSPVSEACSANTSATPVTVEPSPTTFTVADRKADSYRVEVKVLNAATNAACPAVSPGTLPPTCGVAVAAARLSLQW